MSEKTNFIIKPLKMEAASDSDSTFVVLKDVVKTYKMGEVDVHAVNSVNIEMKKGEFVVISGPSGAGKTTVLNLLGGMDSPTSGTITVDGEEISGFGAKKLTTYRRHEIGFVFQFYNLMQNLTALENVEMSSQICKDQESISASEALNSVGLANRSNNFPAQLSGGEQQRVAIARAIVKNPKLILCDEPTGALDYNTGKAILALLWEMCREKNKTVIVITHNTAITKMADKVIYIKNGEVSSVLLNASPLPADDIEW